MSQNPPNILWICTDSQRWDTLGCYGNRFVSTPNADRLAAEGMLFEHCYAQNPLCTPSRGNFLTGRYPVTNKLRQNGQSIPAEEVLVTRILADHDYVCGLSGKLHLSACDRRLTLGPEWWKLPPEERVIQGTERRIDDGYTEFHWSHAPGSLFRSSDYTRWLLARGAAYGTQPRADSAVVRDGMAPELHETTWCAEEAVRFIEGYRGYAHPWLFSVNFFAPHFPFDAPAVRLERYLDRLDDVPLPNYVEGELEDKPAWQLARHRMPHYAYTGETDAGDPHEHRMCRAGYWAGCDQIDATVGTVLDALERTGQRENTIVIFTSDHGELLGDHGVYTKGPFLYDPTIRVPLIVSWPGHVPQGVRAAGAGGAGRPGADGARRRRPAPPSGDADALALARADRPGAGRPNPRGRLLRVPQLEPGQAARLPDDGPHGAPQAGRRPRPRRQRTLRPAGGPRRDPQPLERAGRRGHQGRDARAPLRPHGPDGRPAAAEDGRLLRRPRSRTGLRWQRILRCCAGGSRIGRT